MFRPVAAIIIGYAIFAGSAVILFSLSSQDPHSNAGAGFLILSVAYGSFFALASGYVAAAVTRQAGMRYVFILALLVASGALISLIARPGEGALWSQLAVIFIFAPFIMLGGLLRERHAGRRQTR